ncbi:Molybdate-binding periplasmic protein precursor [Methyloligella halotolerans]|uniref:Molybdate-binding periplasmic protein n=1 Tax=Methyloligella halotolerans TaxID=1177755 RepID=A0A1E2S2G9_9HYPH|nr:molybdate ABC transporter substrate-binding protein [Methyloligella halotolerans]ODA68631.1 Molybdate-binding periplasmic protein precursor [Methyloligella halotolerans]
MTLRIRAGLAAAALVLFGTVLSQPIRLASAQDAGPTVFAAASLKDALDAVNAAWTEETGHSARISYAATSALAKQIVEGAPADIFFSADQDWMDFVEKAGRVEEGTRTDLLENAIVLIAPNGSDVSTTIVPGFPLVELLGGGRLAMANVDAVPAGKYGKASLQSLEVWDAVKDRLAQAQNVRAALALVARGEAPLGIVYRTDAKAESRVRIVGTFPPGSHPPIVYPIAQLTDVSASTATEFLDFLRDRRAAEIFRAQGFGVVPEREEDGDKNL